MNTKIMLRVSYARYYLLKELAQRKTKGNMSELIRNYLPNVKGIDKFENIK